MRADAQRQHGCPEGVVIRQHLVAGGTSKAERMLELDRGKATWAQSQNRAQHALCSLPNPIEYLRCHGSLVLWQEPAIMLGDHVRRIMDGIACLLVRTGMLEDMGGENVPDIMGTMR